MVEPRQKIWVEQEGYWPDCEHGNVYPSPTDRREDMNETEKQIVAWLERRVVSHAEIAEAATNERQKFGHSFTEAVLDSVAHDILRGDHRQHSPAKDD